MKLKNSPPERKEKAKEQQTSIGVHYALDVLVTVLGVFALACSYGWLSGLLLAAFSESELLIFLVPVFIAGMIAFFTVRGASVVWCTVLVGGALSWACAAVYDLVVEGFNLTWIFMDLLLGWLVAFPYDVFPALVWSIIILIAQKVLRFPRKS